MNKNLHDAELIGRLGGPSKVAELLGVSKRGGVQRVHNWITRGIPAAVKVKYPAIFMPELAQAPVNTAHPATENVASEAPEC